VAAEDHRAAQVGAEGPAGAAALLEVAGAQVVGDAGQVAGREGAGAGAGQRVLVHVGGVDLHPVAHRLVAQRFGQHHGDGEGLLAGGAARRPDADRLAAAAGAVEQPRQRVDLQCLPRRRVAEEAGDVDEDGVEEVVVFLGVDLQVVEVPVEALRTGVLDALLHAAQQGAALVAGEVEAVGAAEELEQRLEAGVDLLAHAAVGLPSSSTSASAMSSRGTTRLTAPARMAASGMPLN
jgi:hypothetical protein